MKIKVIASTKVGYKMPKEEAIDFSGKEAEYAIYQMIWKNYLEKIKKKH